MSNLMPLQAFVVTHLWQAIAIALVLAAIFALGRRMSGAVRNALAMTALAMTIALPLATLFVAEGGLASLMPREQRPAAVTTAPVTITETIAPKAVDPDTRQLITTIVADVTRDAKNAALTTIKANQAAKPDWLTLALPDISLALVAIWAIGAAVMLFRLVSDVLAAERLASRARLIKLGGRLGWRTRGLAVAVSHDVAGPMVAGLVKPRVILPEGALERLAPADAEALLAHERAHIERADIPVALLQRVALAVFWWSPALYWISRRADAERELACDEAAVAATGDAHTLAATLVAEAESRLVLPAPVRLVPRLALGAAGSRSELGRRIRRLISFADTGAPRASYAGRLAFAGLVLAMLGAAFISPRIVAQTAPPSPQVGTRSPAAPANPSAVPPAAHADAPEVPEPPLPPGVLAGGFGAEFGEELGSQIEEAVREALEEAGIGPDGELMHGMAIDASKLGLDIANEVQRAVTEAMAQSSLVNGDWSRFAEAWETSFGPEFEARIEAKADAFEAMMEAKFGPDFEAKMEAKGREIEKMMEERFGPDFEARMEDMGRQIEEAMEARFGPEFEAKMKAQAEKLQHFANDAEIQARMQEALARAEERMARTNARILREQQHPTPHVNPAPRVAPVPGPEPVPPPAPVAPVQPASPRH